MTDKSTARALLVDQIRTWPQEPGVYVMRDASKRILYVGKAKNLRNRIRSYFVKDLPIRTQLLSQKIRSLEFTVTRTELEALLLECTLIKKHRPRFNLRLKDDKAFPYVVLDFSHPFPQFRVARRLVPNPKWRYFGPFSGSISEISRFLLKTFQIRDCSEAKYRNRTRPCLNYEIGTCTAPCVAYVTQEAYARQVDEAVLFLQGKKRELLQRFKMEMEAASEHQAYEVAASIRDKVRAIEKLTEKQDVVLVDQVKDIDIVGCFATETELQWVVLFIRGGVLVGRRAEKTDTPVGGENPYRAFLELFYTVSLAPDEIWLAEDFPERAELMDLLGQRAGKKVAIPGRLSETAKRLVATAGQNAKLIYLQAKEKKDFNPLEALQEALGLRDLPEAIEGIDVSNFQGKSPAIALVHFASGYPLKSRYRLYYPKTVEGQNDFAMIYEVVSRRVRDEENPLPDLFLIDGGKGQLASAVKALEDAGVNIPICSLAKSRTESAFTRKEVEKSEERVFVPGRKNPLALKEGNPALRLLQQVRDEAHRFSVESHRRRRTKWAGLERKKK